MRATHRLQERHQVGREAEGYRIFRLEATFAVEGGADVLEENVACVQGKGEPIGVRGRGAERVTKYEAQTVLRRKRAPEHPEMADAADEPRHVVAKKRGWHKEGDCLEGRRHIAGAQEFLDVTQRN